MVATRRRGGDSAAPRRKDSSEDSDAGSARDRRSAGRGKDDGGDASADNDAALDAMLAGDDEGESDEDSDEVEGETGLTVADIAKRVLAERSARKKGGRAAPSVSMSKSTGKGAAAPPSRLDDGVLARLEATRRAARAGRAPVVFKSQLGLPAKAKRGRATSRIDPVSGVRVARAPRADEPASDKVVRSFFRRDQIYGDEKIKRVNGARYVQAKGSRKR